MEENAMPPVEEVKKEDGETPAPVEGEDKPEEEKKW